MKIIVGYPPNFHEIITMFPAVRGRQGIIYSWGDTIYNPNNIKIPRQLIAHEAVHAAQQRCGGVEPWWSRYCWDATFRFSQELPAHQAEWTKYLELNQRIRDRERYLEQMIDRLTGPLYRFGLTRNQARDYLTRVPA